MKTFLCASIQVRTQGYKVRDLPQKSFGLVQQIAVLLTLIFSVIRVSGQDFSAQQLRDYLEDARLSMAVYDLSQTSLENGWRQIRRQSDPDGFQAAAYQRQLPNGQEEIRIAFAGTKDKNNVDTDLSQGLALPTPGDALMKQQYVRAQAFAAGYLQLQEHDKNIASISITGQSLGGSLAQYVTAKTGIPSTVINSSPLVKMENDLTPSERNTANHLVTPLVLNGDVISQLPGTQHGLDHLVLIQPAAGLEVKPSVTVNLGDSVVDTALLRHSVEAVMLSLDSRLNQMEHSTASGFPAQPPSITSDQISRRTAIPTQDAEQVLEQTRAFSKGLSDLVKLSNPTEASPVHEQLEKSLDHANELADAMEKDIDASKNGPASLIHSEVLWKLAEFGFKDGIVPKVYDALKIETKNTPDFGTFEMGRGTIEEMFSGHFNVDSFEHQMDGLVGFTWGAAGYLGSGGNFRTAEIAQQSGQLLARTGRDMTLQTTETVMNGYGDRVLDMYRTYSLSQQARGQHALSIDQWYGDGWEKAKRDLHFTADYDGLAQNYYSLANKPLAAPRTINVPVNPQSPASSLQDIQFATSLVKADTKVLMVGSGPLAAQMQSDLEKNLGKDNVKNVPAVLSAAQLNWLGSSFKADSIVHLVQPNEHFLNDPAPSKMGGVSDLANILSKSTSAMNSTTSLPDPNLNRIPKRPPSTFLPPPADYPKPTPSAIAPGPGRPPPDMSVIRPQFAQAVSSAIGSGLGYQPPYQSPHVGGVMLQGAASMNNPNSPLTSGNFSLIFQGSDGAIDIPTLRRFVTALWATYFTTNGPGISIDPIQGFTNRHVVRYIGRVVNSDLGRVMRETDYQMKSWAVGTSRPDVPNWLTPEELGIRGGTVHVGAPSRFWFVPEKMKFSQADNTLLFESGEMTVKTEYLFGGKGEKSPENEEWAEQFTKRYDDIALHYPIYEELFEYAKLVSLTKYLKERRIPMLWFLLANREMVLTENSPGTVKAFAKKSDYLEDCSIAGGVDLSGKDSPDSYVADSNLVSALAEARKNLPPRNQSASTGGQPTIETVQRTNESLTVTPSQTIVISESRSSGDNFATDLGLRLNGNPHLEIARYRRPDYPRVHTFGRDWHLMIPYAIKPASESRRDFGGWRVPEAMIVQNLLTGREDLLHFDTNKYDIAGYIPDNPDTALNIGLFFLSDRTFRLADKLGCEFDFDESGRLTEMDLAPNYDVQYQYSKKKINWHSFDVLPFRLQPEGDDTVPVQNVSVPKKLRLFDSATGNEQLFTFNSENPTKAARYVPASAHSSDYQFISLMTDGSFLLKHRSGSEITFDADGRFSYMVVDILDKMSQSPYEVRFEYGVAQGQYRIVAARVSDQKTGKILYAVNYEYSHDGNLTGASIASIN